MSDTTIRTRFNRRDFLKAAAISASLVPAYALLTGCAPAAPAAPTTAPAPAAKPTEAPKAADAAKPTEAPKPAAVTPATQSQPAAAGAVKMRWTGLDAVYAVGFPEAYAEAGKRYGATFDFEVTPGDYSAAILTQMAAGTPPDILRTECQVFTTLAGKDVLGDITPYMNDKSFNKDAYFPQLLAGYNWKGKNYSLPEDLQPVSMTYYNKKLFTEAKEPFPTNDWDWKKLVEVATRLTKVSGGRTQSYGYHSQANQWFNHVYAAGGNYIDSIDSPTKVQFSDPKVIEGIQFKTDLIQKLKVSPSPEALTEAGMSDAQLFATGRIAMYTAGTWVAADFLKAGKSLEWGVFITPTGQQGQRKYSTGGSGWAMPKGYKNPELAWKVISFVNGDEGQRIIMSKKQKPWIGFVSTKQFAAEQA
jgi:multiple sugar transport system substrate-binding protein